MTKQEMVKIENDLCAKRFLHCVRAQRVLKEWMEVTGRDLGENHRYCFLWNIGDVSFYLDRGYPDIYYVRGCDGMGENERSVMFSCPVSVKDFSIDISELLKQMYESGAKRVEDYYTNLKA